MATVDENMIFTTIEAIFTQLIKEIMTTLTHNQKSWDGNDNVNIELKFWLQSVSCKNKSNNRIENNEYYKNKITLTTANTDFPRTSNAQIDVEITFDEQVTVTGSNNNRLII